MAANPTKTFRQIRARALRATKVDGCGAPVLGPDSVVTSEGFVTVTLTANIAAGNAIVLENANGKQIVNDTPTPKFVNYGVAIAFAGTDPSLIHLMTGQPLVLDSADPPNVVGFRQNSKIDVDLIGFALELWTGIFSSVCDDSGEPSYGYSLLPFIKGGVIGDVTYANDSINFQLTNASTRDGAGWGVGPFDVTRDEDTNPAPLKDPIDPDGDHLHVELVTVAPPSIDTVGFQALGVPATGAVAGLPGTTTPANSYAPLDIAELIAGASGDHGVTVVASPATAWTTGQSIVLRDGSRAHWSSSAWVAGPA